MNKTIIGIIALVVVVFGVRVLWGGSDKTAMEGDGAMNASDTQDAMMTEEKSVISESDGAMLKDTASSDDAMTDQETGADSMMSEQTDAMMASGGTYETYDASKLSRAGTGKVALFFRASWCPTCRALDADIRAHKGDIPKGVTILDVDYDTAKDLRDKYGVTVQHTLVQVSADGGEIAKWVGSPTLADLVSKLK